MTRRRIFKEDAWTSLNPVQQGLIIGVGAGAVLGAFTDDLPWIAAGVFLGVGIGQRVGRRRARTQSPTHRAEDIMKRRPIPRHTPTPKVVTEEERESSLRSAAWYNGGRRGDGKTDRAGALATMRETIGGFPPERYEDELDAALAGIEEARIRVVARRAEHVAEARELDPLNAVLDLHYFNRWFSGLVGQYGLGRIDLREALGDLYAHEEIDEAVVRSDALIEEGIRMGIGSWEHEPNMAHLRAAHPGFSDRAVSRALDSGHLIYR